MILPDYEKLFKPYTGHKSGTIEAMVAWLRKTSGANEEIISLCIRNLFTELAHGKTFPVDMCDCGCEMKIAHAAINHYVLRETLKLKDEANRNYWNLLEKVDHERILKHVEMDNASYTEENMKPPGKIRRFFSYIFDTSENFKPYHETFIEEE